jgi:hypothetical protein
MILRYIGMLMAGAVAGVLSGILWLMPTGFMGGALGMSLAAGAIWLGDRQRKQRGELTRDQVLQAGLASGLLGGVLMAAISHACSGRTPHEFAPPVLPFWAPLAMGVCYGLVIQWAYSTRRGSSHPLWTVLFRTCLGCFLLKTIATAYYIIVFEDGSEPGSVLFVSTMISLLGAVPFALLWVLAMVRTDPAWRPQPSDPERCLSPA